MEFDLNVGIYLKQLKATPPIFVPISYMSIKKEIKMSACDICRRIMELK